jgi:hypothetical protein
MIAPCTANTPLTHLVTDDAVLCTGDGNAAGLAASGNHNVACLGVGGQGGGGAGEGRGVRGACWYWHTPFGCTTTPCALPPRLSLKVVHIAQVKPPSFARPSHPETHRQLPVTNSHCMRPATVPRPSTTSTPTATPLLTHSPTAACRQPPLHAAPPQCPAPPPPPPRPSPGYLCRRC